MTQASFVRPHGVGVRGSTLARSSLLFEGRFGRIFRALPPADFGDNDAASDANLATIAQRMIADREDDPKEDEEDDEESGIPSIYTYFGQFIDHDLTFDPASSLQRQDDPDALVDYRTPRFDLDNIYGRGPDDQPYFYEKPSPGDPRTLFIRGDGLSGAERNNAGARDLPRNGPTNGDQRAIIGDPRNDENVIVSQFQGLLHRFHNAVSNRNPTWSFDRVQRAVRFHYQWVVLNDFLPTLVSERVLNAVLPRDGNGRFRPNLQFFHFRNEGFMPLEFSAAAYRFGHSMVRPFYRLNPTVGPFPIFDPANPDGSFTGFRKLPGNWAIDWSLFASLSPRPRLGPTRTQLAYRIDTSLVNPLGDLPPNIAVRPSNLAERNLKRGWRMRLPSGQAIARAMGLTPLRDDELLIGKFTGDPADIVGSVVDVGGDAFADNCPLWLYCLAETEEIQRPFPTSEDPLRQIATRQLGQVGGRIVAETFVGLLKGDSSSYLNQDPLWTPFLAGEDGVFGLSELIQTALDG